jgi:cation diffusion facilitator CzcD-associated flavoprotein CzcO
VELLENKHCENEMSRAIDEPLAAVPGWATEEPQKWIYPLEHEAFRRGLRPQPMPPPLPDAVVRIDRLSDRVRHDLAILSFPKDDWVLPRRHPDGHHAYDVLIVGAGQCGLAAAFGLMREHVTNVLVVDQAPPGREGPWISYSRMWTLRSPKHLTGPDLGIPSLAPRSWFEAVFGEDAWQKLDKWPRHAWQDYLIWYREATRVPVRNGIRVDAIEPDGGFIRVVANRRGAGSESTHCRKLILATGIEGMGGWYIPPVVRDNTAPDDWTMCTDDVDSIAWAGQRIAVLGAGATAWDRAADLLELGAKSVTMYMRRKQILTANVFRYLEKAGFLRHYASMSDADKWRWMQTIFTFGQPPTQDGVDRCAYFDNFVLHPGATWSAIRRLPSGIEVTGSDGSVAVFDHLFIGAGFSVNPLNRPELAPFADQILTWADVIKPPREYRDDWLITYPYLERDLSFMERTPGAAPFLRNIYCFNYGATVTNAHSGASLSGMKYGIEPLIHGVTLALWKDDEPAHFRAARAWSDVDTDPSPLSASLWPPKTPPPPS